MEDKKKALKQFIIVIVIITAITIFVLKMILDDGT